MRFQGGHRFSKVLQLTEESTSDFAAEVGDLNPIHHDDGYAEKSWFGHLVASGPQTSALMMSFTATYFSQYSPMVGLEFNFRFNSPVKADDKVKLEWMVVDVRRSEKFGGQLIDLRGRLVDSKGLTAVGAKGKVLLSDKFK